MALGSGVSINLFEQWVAETGPSYLRGTREVVNDAQTNNFNTLGYLLRGQNMSDVLQGGTEIRDVIYLQANRRGRTYKPNERQTPELRQRGQTWSADWRFTINDIVWNDETVELQGSDGMSPEKRHQIYKNYWWGLQQDMWTDEALTWEERYWAVPDLSEMEAASGQELFSIPCFINEYPNGLPAASDQPGGTWTTVMGLDPTDTDKTNWAPQQFGYGSAGNATGYTVNNQDNVIETLDEAIMALDFRPPPIHREMFEGMYRMPVEVIFASRIGRARLMGLFRRSQDRWVDMRDPYNNPTYQNAPIVYIAQLDSAPIYPTGASDALGAESSAANTTNTNSIGYQGPRYYLISPMYLRTVWHTNRYMKMLPTMTDVEQPTTHVIYVNSYANTLRRSGRRHGILYPLADHDVF